MTWIVRLDPELITILIKLEYSRVGGRGVDLLGCYLYNKLENWNYTGDFARIKLNKPFLPRQSLLIKSGSIDYRRFFYLSD